jgi:hypothetical protein
MGIALLGTRGSPARVFGRPTHDVDDSPSSLMTYQGMGSSRCPPSADAPLLPVLCARRIPLATHVDGLSWQWARWGATGHLSYQPAEALVRAPEVVGSSRRRTMDNWEFWCLR